VEVVDHERRTVFLSIVFTWDIDAARARALWHRALGLTVKVGGPAVFHPKMKALLADVAEVGGALPDAVALHNPAATFASRGCPVGCSFCIVPAMEGREFTLLPDFTPRPILCDNNLSALPAEYQEHIISRYRGAGVPLLNANSGFEPATFTEEVYRRWKPVNLGPWRFAYDEQRERADVRRVFNMLRAEPAKKKRVYVLIGNEPRAACLERIGEVIAWGGEPYVQPYMKLTARVKAPHVMHDWTDRELRDVQKWANAYVWRRAPFSEFRRSLRLKPRKPLAAIAAGQLKLAA